LKERFIPESVIMSRGTDRPFTVGLRFLRSAEGRHVPGRIRHRLYCQSNVAGVHAIMKSFCFAAVFVLLTAGCSSTGSLANNQSAPPNPADTDTYILHATDGATPGGSVSKPPRLSVGVSYPDTQLILPWFLNDIINLVNYR
jgi:hypothetical protein